MQAAINLEMTPKCKVIRRNGQVTDFDGSKIQVAMTKAFLDVEGSNASGSARIHDTVRKLTAQVVDALLRRTPDGGMVHIEDIQDQVELALMRAGEHKVARSYVLYRAERARLRAEKDAKSKKKGKKSENVIHVKSVSGDLKPLDEERLRKIIAEAVEGLEGVSAEQVMTATMRNLYDGISEKEVATALIISTRVMIDREPNYSQAAARMLMDSLRREALSFLEGQHTEATQHEMVELYAEVLKKTIQIGVKVERLADDLGRYDLAKLGAAIKPERDLQFTYLGLQTLYDRYFLHHDGVRFELPQVFFMRVAMGLAINEVEREDRAIEFYNLLSSFDFMSSTPTLFNSGTLRPQLSSCYLTTVPDHLEGIYDAIKDNALLSKYAGGLGNDWSRVRGMGAHIKGTNGKSQGVVPFLKVANDTAVAVNQCFAPDTQLHTADGIKAIRDVKAGDLVLGISGTYREVKRAMVYNQHDAMVALDVKHSIEPVKVTAGHPFYALRGVPLEQANDRAVNWLAKGKVKPEWVEAAQLQKGDYVAQVIPTETVMVDGFDADDARLYGILLGDGHLSKDGMQWGISGNPQNDSHLDFVREYLAERGIHSWENGRGETYTQIHWASGRGVVRNATNGRIVGAGAATLPFSYDDIYNAPGEKRISRQFSHLPRPQTLALIQGLLETDGGVSRGKEIYFTNTSRQLAEGLRYQCLRLGVPTAGQYRERDNAHTGTRSDGTQIEFNGITKAFDIRIPAVPEIAALVACQPIDKRNWLTYNGCVFSRVRSVETVPTLPFVFDLIVEGDESYMTTAALAHNGGKRKGAVCAYLETWHIDIEDFLELRKNTGDERRRTHDMNTANWIPDLFMKRVAAEAEWTLFSPDDAPDLHDLTGKAFEARYAEYEAKAARGEMKLFRKLPALQLWRKMLGMIFETGHPWITFKDPCNVRYTNQHMGVVHSSNLCTEITLHTNDSEIAVCNLGSVNLTAHVNDGKLDVAKLERTVTTAMRMLDNVIDYNYYSVPQARKSNLRHRPVGMGIMGFQDALYKMNLAYATTEAVEFADQSMEAVSYFAIRASSNLAAERGKYPSYNGSLWSKGILPIDSLELLGEERGEYFVVDHTQTLDWDALRNQVKAQGMRNSNVMAIAPTATISNICGVSQSIEPTYQNLFVKSNLSGEFTVINPYLVQDLKALGMWDEVMINDLKYFDGSLQPLDRVPDALKAKYATAFEIDARWLVEAASRRQKWIDQGQSLNLYMKEPNGTKLDNLYKLAWVRGLKTTYYLRTLGATGAEKTSSDDSSAANSVAGIKRAANLVSVGSEAPKACSLLDPECEACQ
ncbi:ribonucleoside-diphosphate reductase subunit alpha [Thiothrix subterranea]|uniref:ribonucleoside-diphosphate reductase subunit alpha n=1 Tax=Thiothrix subterranea TaxID=2735563 RepID=UPI00192B962C|nr:ribonucleoside-diphosphate reductase subunit alpha [Thiothrix subterranea]QQZ29141.1 ribonucleoside-diphosphate reductase subunit alpha [Thiothrix subterranea]